jgi:hypothetical protein
VLQGCYKGITRILLEWARQSAGVTKVLQGCYKGVARVSEGFTTLIPLS